MQEFYLKNSDFRSYVDKYCRTYRLTVHQALQHALVKAVYEMYVTEEKR